jgi:hypothetical protein
MKKQTLTPLGLAEYLCKAPTDARSAKFQNYIRARRKRPRAVDPRNMPESHEMKLLTPYLNHRFGVRGWAHMPNERKLRGEYAYYQSLLQQGFKPDHPDVVIYVSPPYSLFKDEIQTYYKGAAIELKRCHDSEATEGQLEWGKAFENMGYLFYVAHGFEDARQWIENYYGKR